MTRALRSLLLATMKSTLTRACLTAVALSLVACGSSSTDIDAGTPLSDLGAMDSGTPGVDLGDTDADSPAVDLGDLDSGTAPVDLGLPPDDAGAPSSEGCFTGVSAGHHLFACDGINYDVEVSPACAMGGRGLIFDVHGATMDADSEDLNTNLRALGSAAGYVVVQPTAPASTFGPSWDPTRDDPKVFAFLELTMRAMRVDARRVHFTGFSQGGFMSWRMLCAHAEVFASVAPAAACGALFRQCPFTPTDRPSEEIPVLYIHGSRDTIVAGCSGAMRDAVVAGWSMSPMSPVSMDADYTWSRYASAGGNVFEFIDHSYSARSLILGGHCLPGSPDISATTFSTSGYGCDHTSPITWGQAVLAFFQAHPRP